MILISCRRAFSTGSVAEWDIEGSDSEHERVADGVNGGNDDQLDDDDDDEDEDDDVGIHLSRKWQTHTV